MRRCLRGSQQRDGEERLQVAGGAVAIRNALGKLYVVGGSSILRRRTKRCGLPWSDTVHAISNWCVSATGRRCAHAGKRRGLHGHN